MNVNEKLVNKISYRLSQSRFGILRIQSHTLSHRLIMVCFSSISLSLSFSPPKVELIWRTARAYPIMSSWRTARMYFHSKRCTVIGRGTTTSRRSHRQSCPSGCNIWCRLWASTNREPLVRFRAPAHSPHPNDNSITLQSIDWSCTSSSTILS